MKHAAIVFVFALALLGCENEAEVSTFSEVAEVAMVYDEEEIEEADMAFSRIEGNVDKQSVDAGKKIIRTASANIQVENLEKSIESFTALASAFNGYVQSSNSYDSYSQLNGDLQIRVPAENLDSLLKRVFNEAIYVQSKNISSRDITEEFVDTEIRLKNKKAVEQQYLEILKSAKTIKEILQVQNELRVIREEIESKEGRLKYLRNQVSYSTLSLSAYQLKESVAQAPGKSFMAKIRDGIIGGWKSMLAGVVAISYLWPYLLLAAMSVLIILRRYRKRKTVVG